MENWSSICDKPSNEVRVFPGCDFQIRVNGPSPSEQKPVTKTFYSNGDSTHFRQSHWECKIVMDVVEKKSARWPSTRMKQTKIKQFYYL